MAVPKRRKSQSKRDIRRANHDKVAPPNLGACPKCGEAMLPHRVCPACGYYKGRRLRPGAREADEPTG